LDAETQAPGANRSRARRRARAINSRCREEDWKCIKGFTALATVAPISLPNIRPAFKLGGLPLPWTLTLVAVWRKIDEGPCRPVEEGLQIAHWSGRPWGRPVRCTNWPISSERQEPHRTLAHGPKPYDRTGDEPRLSGVERIRI